MCVFCVLFGYHTLVNSIDANSCKFPFQLDRVKASDQEIEWKELEAITSPLVPMLIVIFLFGVRWLAALAGFTEKKPINEPISVVAPGMTGKLFGKNEIA